MTNNQKVIGNDKANNPPKGECRQCWLHAYASREVHAHLRWREDCPECVSHMHGRHPEHMIVK
ncbi:pRL2-8 (plasmid) [Kitasatospora sp. NBC_01246]|uniref:pRL2-8 n=1 Tax=Kitasatospora sp. NBC_01246 TaxID=2903570 RepID=UPI002E326C37|nr:pRL2-8 [Kitasatospora sp. NBC_01246]